MKNEIFRKEWITDNGKDSKGEYVTDKERVSAYGIYDFFMAANPEYMINGRFYKFDDIKKRLLN